MPLTVEAMEKLILLFKEHLKKPLDERIRKLL
jgi:hypothetical protein